MHGRVYRSQGHSTHVKPAKGASSVGAKNQNGGGGGEQGRVVMYPGGGPVECCEGGSEGAEAGPGPAPCPVLPAEPCGWAGLLTGVKEGAFTFSLNS